MIITIDGPAGSGKSFVAKELAKKLDVYYLYTGLLYRAVAYILLKKFGKKLTDLDKVTEKELGFIADISYEYVAQEPQIYFKKENITQDLNLMSLDQAASIISAQKDVRGELLNLQRSVAEKYDIVADGRDCGTVVFPNADYKFYLTASLDERAKRIYADKNRAALDISIDKIKEELEVRDKRDTNRKVAPLTIPDNGIIIDNSDLSKQDTIKEFLRFIEK